MLIRIGAENEVKKVQITGVAHATKSLKRRLEFVHPGGRDGRIGARQALRDEGQANNMAAIIGRARAKHPTDGRAQALHVMQEIDPGVLPRDGMLRAFERLLRQAIETQPTTHDAAMWLIGALT